MQQHKMQEFKTALVLALGLGLAVMCFGAASVAASFIAK
jgi:hypothetical protein